MSFKVTFIFYNNLTAYSWSPAIQALSAYIKRHSDCETELIHINDRYGVSSDAGVIVERLRLSMPDLIAFTSTSFGYNQVNELAGRIKKEFPEILFILGGVHATLKPEDLISSNFDAYCIGEGEKPLLNLINRIQKGLNYTGTPSFQFKFKGAIVKNPIEPYEKNLDNLPSYDWDIFNSHKLLELRKGWISLSFSRGCPFNCNFCINHRMKYILGAKGYVRQKSVKRSIEELLGLIDKFPSIKVFNFEDDILIFNKSWTDEFIREYKKNIYEKYGIKFKIESRVDLINEEIVKELKEAGCQEIQFGVETGNSRLRNFVLNKSISDEQIISAFDLCRKYGVNTLAFIMLGVPGETEATVMDTIRLLAMIKPYLIRPSFIFPIYGTEFYNYCAENKLLKEGIGEYETYLWTQGVPVRLNGIAEDVLIRYMVLLPWYINAELGLEDYKSLISEYGNKRFITDDKTRFKVVLEADRDKNHELTSRNISHYRYFNDELNYLQYVKGA